MQPDPSLPTFLKDYVSLRLHFEENFKDLGAYERGRVFARFTQQLVPQTDFGKHFDPPELRQDSHDEGIDLIAQSPDETGTLCIQAKYAVSDKADFDSIISKFRNYFQNHYSTSSTPLFDYAGIDLDREPIDVYFQIVTMHDLREIIRRYEASQFGSKAFYDRLVQACKLEIIDGPKILSVLQNIYRKAYIRPPQLHLNFHSPFIKSGNVYIGILSGDELRRLYDEHGDAVFFENIRDFLGETSGKKLIGGRTTVNQEIIRTVTEMPDQLLSRNNGITFKAAAVQILSDTQLQLNEASIVNGCQTTMCIVLHAKEDCLVLAKVVETAQAWDVAQAANYQTEIPRIDLDLARFLRPQIVRKAAFIEGVRLDPRSQTVFGVLDTVYQGEVAYDEVRALFIGLFSRTPNNVFENNYTELRADLIARLYQTDPEGAWLFERLFEIQGHASDCNERLEQWLNEQPETVGDHYQRFFRAEKPSYRAFLTLLAASAACRIDISDRKADTEAEFARVSKFLDDILSIVQNELPDFIQSYKAAFRAIAVSMPADKDKERQLQTMHAYLSGAKFENLLRQTHLLMM